MTPWLQNRLLLLSATHARGFAWYYVDETGAKAIEEDDLPGLFSGVEPLYWSKLEQFMRPGRLSLAVYADQAMSGVVLSDVPSGRLRMGRAINQTFIIVSEGGWFTPWQKGIIETFLLSSADHSWISSFAKTINEKGPAGAEGVTVDLVKLSSLLNIFAADPTFTGSAQPLVPGIYKDSPKRRVQLHSSLLNELGRELPHKLTLLAVVGYGVRPELFQEEDVIWGLTTHSRAEETFQPQELISPTEVTRSKQTGCLVAPLMRAKRRRKQ